MGPNVDEQELSDQDELGYTHDPNLMKEDELQENPHQGWNQDPNTGAYVSPDGGSMEFPDQPINPNPTAQAEVNEFLDPLLKGMEEPSEPSPWEQEIPEPPPGMFD